MSKVLSQQVTASKVVFEHFAKAVHRSFLELSHHQEVFVVDISGDVLYERYLSSFPAGTNPLYKTNTEHDCTCCKQFIRRIGNVVSVGPDKRLRTVWDGAAGMNDCYGVVARQLRDAVLNANICDLFRTGPKENKFGAQITHSLDAVTLKALTWKHFYSGDLPSSLISVTPDQAKGDYRTTVQVFERGLRELSKEAVSTVLDLITSNSLYRGEEHKQAVLEFQKAQKEFLGKSTESERNLFLWTKAHGPASRFRNTVIGTLVQDLSEGKDLERAVASFETKVAPQNYKRTTALITPGMVKAAMATIEELGLESALERRFAVLSDISVNDVLWVDGATKPLMKGGIGDVLMQHATSKAAPNKDEERATSMSLDEFVSQVLPQAKGLELLFKGEHLGNLMSLTAPVDPAPKQLFRWNNDFAWSYGGNVADSIKERVRKAGGQIVAQLRVSLSWSNWDDLDLHIIQPPKTAKGIQSLYDRIYFGQKVGHTGGQLDVDMNAGMGRTREPVENVFWKNTMPDGPYQVIVNNFCFRESSNPGFVVEIENAGRVSHYSYNKGVRHKQDIHVATLHMKSGVIDRIEVIDPTITASNISQEKWGLNTEQYAKVSAVTLSPNYWQGNAVGNKHTFFVLQDAINDEDTRGFYNEFLHPRLEAHRKVFEVIADKTKCQPTAGQLSGLGFSSTKKDSFLVRVNKQRLYNVQVGG